MAELGEYEMKNPEFVMGLLRSDREYWNVRDRRFPLKVTVVRYDEDNSEVYYTSPFLEKTESLDSYTFDRFYSKVEE